MQSYEGTADIDFTHNSFNLKLGAKLGGLFYFRPEVGYAFSSYPEDIEFDADEAPQSLLFDGLIFNIGFGFSF